MAITNATASAESEMKKAEQAVTAEAVTEPSDTTETTEATPAQAPEMGEAYKELMEKKGFKNAEDLAKAYKALESRSTKVDQSRQQLEDQLIRVQEAQKQQNLPPEQEQALKLLESTIERVISNKLRPIQESIGVSKVDKMISDMQSQHPDFKGSIVDETMDYMLDHKGVAMEDAYKILTWDQRRANVQREESIEAKKSAGSRAYVESASSAKNSKDVDYSKLSLAEMEDIIPSSGDFVDSKGRLRKS